MKIFISLAFFLPFPFNNFKKHFQQAKPHQKPSKNKYELILMVSTTEIAKWTSKLVPHDFFSFFLCNIEKLIGIFLPNFCRKFQKK